MGLAATVARVCVCHGGWGQFMGGLHQRSQKARKRFSANKLIGSKMSDMSTNEVTDVAVAP